MKEPIDVPSRRAGWLAFWLVVKLAAVAAWCLSESGAAHLVYQGF